MMEKIKVLLTSGNTLEKPLISAFKNNEKQYVILDNELNGSMGLPIILVTSLIDGKLQKIVDKSPEWEEAKGLLRNIIAGEEIEYISIPNEISAEDVFFTQLTLPVASYDALKNKYVVKEEPKEELVETPVEPQVPEVPSTPVEQPVVEPVMPSAPVETQTEAIVQPEEPKEVAPVEPKVEIDYQQEKEAFLKACENMFDALVTKFNRK